MSDSRRSSPHHMKGRGRVLTAREWLYQGGGGLEIERGDEKSLSVTFEGLVGFLESYAKQIREETLEEAIEAAYDCHYSKGPRGECGGDHDDVGIGVHNQTILIAEAIRKLKEKP